MDRWQAQYSFWSGFGIPAYEENSVPTGENRPTYPYLTYQAVMSGFNEDAPVSASIWDRGDSWDTVDRKANDILTALSTGGRVIGYDTGMIWVTADTPFAQSMGDMENDYIKRTVISVVMHFA